MIEGLYDIQSFEYRDNIIYATISLNKDHAIYKAHFPNHPITPGVCIIQIALELIERHYDKPLRIIKVNNVKFLKVISPEETNEIDYIISTQDKADGIKAMINVCKDECQFSKMSIDFQFEK
jgi:3-hydroxyacyl-[acyl-carrier-protein] dehydratase